MVKYLMNMQNSYFLQQRNIIGLTIVWYEKIIIEEYLVSSEAIVNSC